MAVRQDIIFENNDAVVKDGDFLVSDSNQQHIEDTIIAAPGWWNEFFEEGVSAKLWLGAPVGKQEIARKIRLELENDGYKVSNPEITYTSSGEVVINPNATI